LKREKKRGNQRLSDTVGEIIARERRGREVVSQAERERERKRKRKDKAGGGSAGRAECVQRSGGVRCRQAMGG
jgi:hypothetical protein